MHMWLNCFAVHLKLTQQWKSTILSFLKINKKLKKLYPQRGWERILGTWHQETSALSPCSAPLTCSSRGPPAEAMGCRWGHQLCGVDGTSRSIFHRGLGKHLEPRLGKTKDDDKILAGAGKNLTVTCDSCDEGWQGGSSWHWARWQPWVILHPPPPPPSCSPPQQHAHRDTQRNGLKLCLPLCHSAVASRREGPQTKSPVSSQDLLSLRKIFERNQIARNYQTQIPPPQGNN